MSHPPPSDRRARSAPAAVPVRAVRPRSTTARGEILASAQAILLEAGIDGFSIRRVSDRCGYSAPTLYHHFGDKSGLLDAALEERFAEVVERMRALPNEPDPVSSLRAMAEAFIGFALEYPAHYRLLSVPRPQAEIVASAEAARELVKHELERLAEQGLLAAPDVDSGFQVLWAVLHGVVTMRLTRPDDQFSHDTVRLALDTVERGLFSSADREKQ